MTTEPSPAFTRARSRAQLTAQDTLKKRAIHTVVFAVLFIWFAYDGWFNPTIQAKTFNQIGAVVWGIGLLVCLILLGRAALAVRRQHNQQPPPAS
ncbi:MAG: hypothetical protein N3B01_00525 [Verrucomicrobiae bacterium]|nr:hypothetical protein [Verrucomicrobiae bacterium]